MTDYGVTAHGFEIKPLATILAEIQATNITTFGPGVIQSAASPLGQLNGMFAELSIRLWELALASYAAADPDQAEGTRLDALARLRLLERATGEEDTALRSAITNVGRAQISLADIERAALGVSSVTFAYVWENASGAVDDNGQPANSLCIAAVGGDDETLASAIQPYIVPGVSTYGNTPVSIIVSGRCRTLSIMRPTVIPLNLAITVNRGPDRYGCPPASFSAISASILAGLTGDNAPRNGDDITTHMVEIAMAVYPNVELVSATAWTGTDTPTALPYAIGFDQIADLSAGIISVSAA